MLSILLEKMLKESINVLDDFDYEGLNNEPIHIYSKDNNGKYLSANKLQAINAGLPGVDDLIGTKDNDLCWEKYANCYQQFDKKVMFENKTSQGIEPGILTNNQHIKCFSIKTPLKSKMGKTIGIMGITYFEHIEAPILVENNLLSPQQIKCLYYLCRGKTSKQIALVMDLSFRTIEHYIAAIKIKLNCHTRQELIANAFEIGITSRSSFLS